MSTLSLKEKKEIREKSAMPLLWLGIVSMVMIFAGLTSAYVVRKGKGDWLQFDMPQMFYVSTAIILLSSVTMNWVLASAKKNDLKSIKLAAFITFVLGFAFIICQFKAWVSLVDQKVFFAGKYSNAAGSYMYMLTVLHLAHLIGGMIALGWVWIKSMANKYNSENLLGIRLCAIFWHFLDVLWIFLFLFLSLFR
ncbi:MAG: cytochrome c oxidase subunit 3 [Bacteroidota bacterium]